MNASPNDTCTTVDGANQQAPTAAGARTNRTCTACQRRKIRCIVPVQEGTNTDLKQCLRCSRLGVACVFPAPATKKTRKRNENRIQELERRLEAIQHAVTRSQATTADVRSPHPTPEKWTQTPCSGSLETAASSQFPVTEPIFDETPPTSQMTDRRQVVNDTHRDPIASGLITHGFAKELFENFRENLAPLYPIVLLPTAPLAWETLRSDRPAVYRAVLTASSSSIDPGLSETLFRDTARFLVDRVFLAGEKSLDLVQALLVMSVWYLPPKNFKDLNFTQYAHAAATMVTELRSSLDNQDTIPEIDASDASSAPSEVSLEACRTFVACYLICSSMAVSFRRPTALQCGPWLEDCLHTLETRPSLQLNDRRLASWTRLQHIAEESLTTARLYNKSSSMDFSDPRTQFVLKSCIKRVAEWEQSVKEGVMNETISMHYHMLLLSLHEPALYDAHNLTDFKPPYTIRTYPLTKPTASTKISIEVAHALTQCVISARQILHNFIGLSKSILLSAPVITYTRMTYAVVILTKLHVSRSSSSSATSLLLQNEDTSPKEFLLKLISRLEFAAGPELFRVPAVFHSALCRLKGWCDDHLDQPPGQQRNALIEPMMHLSIDDNVNSGINKKVSMQPTTSLSSADSAVGLTTDTQLPVIPSHWDGSSSLTSGIWLDPSDGVSVMDFSDRFFDFIFVDHNPEDSYTLT